ncbi:uncharacterized protein KZ484_003261 [Pholidichthys leucotaenia]
MTKCLKVGEAEFVAIRLKNEEPQLCAFELHIKPPVYITSRRMDENRNEIHMAFRFPYGNESYSPCVDGGQLKLVKATGEDKIPESHWFVKCNLGAGEHYGLQSVTEPQKYISRIGRVGRGILTLVEAKNQLALVKDESCNP